MDFDVLKQNYPDAIAAAETYGLKRSSWEELAKSKDWGNPVNDRAMLKDGTDFLHLMKIIPLFHTNAALKLLSERFMKKRLKG